MCYKSLVSIHTDVSDFIHTDVSDFNTTCRSHRNYVSTYSVVWCLLSGDLADKVRIRRTKNLFTDLLRDVPSKCFMNCYAGNHQDDGKWQLPSAHVVLQFRCNCEKVLLISSTLNALNGKYIEFQLRFIPDWITSIILKDGFE